MDYKTAIAKLQAEQPDLADVIITHVSQINSESAERRVALKELQMLVESLKKIAGNDTDLVEYLTNNKKTVDDSMAVLTDTQTKLETALQLAATESRKYTLLKAAQISGADEAALNKLLENVETKQIILEKDQVKINSKTLKDYAAEQGDWMVRALFASSPNGKMPTGGGKSEEPVNPTNAYLQQRQAGVLKSLRLPQN
jgi:thioester reductase-like protein